MVTKLLYRDAYGRDVAVDLPQDRIHYLGRDRECIVCTDDASVSPRAASLRFTGGRWSVEATSPASIVFLNDRSIRGEALRHNDVIRCGTLQVRFVEVTDAHQAARQGAGPSARPTPGQLVGPYRLVRLLGSGGMGAVFEAMHESLGRRAAIKVLHADISHQPQWVTRFFNEARAVNIIRHPGIVDVSDFGQLEDGGAYLVMEYLAGESLAQRLKGARGLAVPTVLQLGRQIAAALHAAHDKHIVHRDLKPDNVYLVPDPLVAGGERTKLLDFGIAKLAAEHRGGGTLTQRGMIMGTPQYMSPEQCAGAGQVDEKSDAYSLGIMLYEMLAGQVPFVHPAPVAMMTMHLMNEPRPITELVPGLPAPLGALVHELLHKEPAARPGMQQVMDRLAHIGQAAAPPRPAPPRPAPRPWSGKIRYAAKTDVGMKEPHNQDYFSLVEDESLFTVEDGEGPMGEVASKMAADTMHEFYKRTQDEEAQWPYKMDHKLSYVENRLVCGIKLANWRIYEAASKDPSCRGMRSALVAMVVIAGQISLAHVGQCRGYRLRQGELQQLTVDHTMAGDYLEAHPDATEEELADLTNRNVLTRALGWRDTAQIDIRTEAVQGDDLILLCSDGLSGMLVPDALRRLLDRGPDLEATVNELVDHANRNGGLDNITAILIHFPAA